MWKHDFLNNVFEYKITVTYICQLPTKYMFHNIFAKLESLHYFLHALNLWPLIIVGGGKTHDDDDNDDDVDDDDDNDDVGDDDDDCGWSTIFL